MQRVYEENEWGKVSKRIVTDSTGMTRFWQESQGHDKDLVDVQKSSALMVWLITCF